MSMSSNLPCSGTGKSSAVPEAGWLSSLLVASGLDPLFCFFFCGAKRYAQSTCIIIIFIRVLQHLGCACIYGMFSKQIPQFKIPMNGFQSCLIATDSQLNIISIPLKINLNKYWYTFYSSKLTNSTLFSFVADSQWGYLLNIYLDTWKLFIKIATCSLWNLVSTKRT